MSYIRTACRCLLQSYYYRRVYVICFVVVTIRCKILLTDTCLHCMFMAFLNISVLETSFLPRRCRSFSFHLSHIIIYLVRDISRVRRVYVQTRGQWTYTNKNNRSKKLIQIIIIYLEQQMSAAKIWYASGTLVIITCVYRKNGRYVLKTIFSSFFFRCCFDSTYTIQYDNIIYII